MKVGMIGLGDIAHKAYLPVVGCRGELDLFICTRNSAGLEEIGGAFRIPREHRFSRVQDMVEAGVEAVFVHTATEAHLEIVSYLLERGIHVYVDKPIDSTFARSDQIVQLANRRGLVLMVGFNRRYAPLYRAIYDRGKPDLVIMQKNRVNLPGSVRSVIFDDFIHVVDTLLFLLGSKSCEVQVRHRRSNGQLSMVMVTLTTGERTAVGVMNRDSGISEEILEAMMGHDKFRVADLRETTQYSLGQERTQRIGDWTSVGVARGFEAIVDAFLSRVRASRDGRDAGNDSLDLMTHRVCEDIVAQIEAGGTEE